MDTKQKVKKIALELFAKKGYDAASLKEIAEKAGIKTPSLYAHFSGKEEIFLQVYEDVIKEHVLHVNSLMEKIENHTSEEKLYIVLKETCTYYFQKEVMMTFLKRVMLFPPPGLAEGLREKFLESEELLSSILKQIYENAREEALMAGTNFESFAASFLCMLDGLFIQMFYYGPEQFEERLNSVWQIFWRGINSSRNGEI